MNYNQTASQILAYIGGKENLISAAHCATRLRLVIGDNDKVNKEEVENIDGVKGVFFAAGQLQIILGTGVVNKVYEEFIPMSGMNKSSKEEVKQAANVAQGAAALAVGIKTKNQKLKSMALPSSLSAFMGITEPAIFGVNLRYIKPFIAG